MIQQDYLKSLRGLSEAEEDSIFGALVRAFFTGESQEGRFEKADNPFLLNIYIGLETQLMRSRRNAIAGSKGGKKRSENMRASKGATKRANEQDDNAANDTERHIALCPRCFKERESESPHIFYCPECDITWRTE